MNKTLVLFFAIAISSSRLMAQEIDSSKPGFIEHFNSYNTIQLLNGSTATSFALNSVNGFQFGKFFSGIGTGFDYYYHTSVPLFLEARLDLAKQKGKLQLFGNGGLSFPFSSQNKKLEFKQGPYKTGSMFGGGFDYLIPSKKEAIILGVAFSNKQIIRMVDNNIWNPVLNRIENIPIKDKYSLNRVAIRIGWMF